MFKPPYLYFLKGHAANPYVGDVLSYVDLFKNLGLFIPQGESPEGKSLRYSLLAPKETSTTTCDFRSDTNCCWLGYSYKRAQLICPLGQNSNFYAFVDAWDFEGDPMYGYGIASFSSPIRCYVEVKRNLVGSGLHSLFYTICNSKTDADPGILKNFDLFRDMDLNNLLYTRSTFHILNVNRMGTFNVENMTVSKVRPRNLLDVQSPFTNGIPSIDRILESSPDARFVKIWGTPLPTKSLQDWNKLFKPMLTSSLPKGKHKDRTIFRSKYFTFLGVQNPITFLNSTYSNSQG